ncbi:MAG: type II toxin-antitoxin system VapC family toxin [Rhodopirellula sp.]|nr:type II toxin-antitoxin system VapC family toxin [Rhodopirellula sp.]
MTRTVLLDAGTLGLLTAPPLRQDAHACSQWLAGLIRAKVRVLIPEITDYELWRELLRAGKTRSVQRLDALGDATEYLPITTPAMRRAAELWAQARQQGQPTAADNTIDADMILAAQALTLEIPDVVIATTNVGHLARFVPAESWQSIVP